MEEKSYTSEALALMTSAMLNAKTRIDRRKIVLQTILVAATAARTLGCPNADNFGLVCSAIFEDFLEFNRRNPQPVTPVESTLVDPKAQSEIDELERLFNSLN
jgi:hypothetical protein